MALTVGELNGIITIDDRAVNPALRRAENALRASGNRMGDDAERAGQQAGAQLGQGLVRGADGQWRNMRGQLVDAVTAAAAEAEAQAHRAGLGIGDGVTSGLNGLRGDAAQVGRQAGDDLGEGLTDGAAAGADDAVAATESKLDRLKTVALGAGVAAGAVLVDAFGQAMEQEQITVRLGATLGKTPAEAQRYGHIAGELYANAVTADFQEAADTIGNVMGSGLIKADATNAEIEKVSTKVADLANLFGQDLVGVTNAATQLIRTGLAKNATEALDLIAAGFGTSANKADDLLDTLNEYSVQFKRVGLDGKTSIGLINQAIGAGAKDSDQVADAIGQFGEIALAGGKAVETAFKSIGLNSDDIAKKLQKGGKDGQQALQMTTDALRNTKDETVRLNAAGALFGDPGKVMADALFALDPASAAASSGMNKAAGAADKLGKGVRDTAAVQVEQFKRKAMQGLVDFLGTRVIPVLTKVFSFVQEHSGAFKIAGLAITAVLVPALVLMGVTATVAAGRVVWGWTTSGAAAIKSAAIQTGSALRTAGAWTLMKARAVGSFVATAASATWSAARTAGAWLLTAAKMTGTFLVAVIRVAVVSVAQFALMAARAIAWAAVMAAQWLIAMGPIGWVIAAIIGLTALVIANWDTVKKWTGVVWNWVSMMVKVAVAATVGWVMGLAAIPGLVAGYFGRMKDAAVRKALELVAWVRGLPGRTTAALSSMGGNLANSGSSAFQRLRNAANAKVVSMIAWVRGIPGQARSALGNLGGVLWNAGASLLQGFINGLISKVNSVKNTLTGLTSKLTSWKGPESVDKKILTPAGRMVIAGFQAGIDAQTPALRKQLLGLTRTLPDVTMQSPALAGVGALPGGMGGNRQAAGGGSGPSVLRIEFAGPEEVTRLIRGIVKDKGGGSVQLALGNA